MSFTKLPWWIKIILKLVLALIPIRYEKVRSMLTGRYGAMQSSKYADRIFNQFINDFENFSEQNKGVLLELGPGGSLLSGVMGRAAGFEKCILVDVGDFASKDRSLYLDMVTKLKEEDRELFLSALSKHEDVMYAFNKIGIIYLTNGLQSLREIPDKSVIFSFSNAVLEHIRVGEFNETIKELYRIHLPESISSHHIDFKDHLGGSLNNLRFSKNIWESDFFPNSGFYTNRLRHKEVVNSFIDTGFLPLNCQMNTWKTLPISKANMSSYFQKFNDSDLMISSSHIVFKKQEAL
jgi:hypothetical protein